MILATRTTLAAALASAAFCSAGAATAQPNAHTLTDSARVLSSTPVYEASSEPRQQCHTEYRSEPPRAESSAPLGAIAGGVIGGVIGHQFGNGRGNTAATIGGAVAGAAIGNQVDRNNRGDVEPRTQAVERCDTVGEPRDTIVGYDVVYSYDGREFSTRLPYDPGRWIDVDETGEPLGQSRPR